MNDEDNPGFYMAATEVTLRDYFAARAMQAILSTLAQGIRPVDIPRMCEDTYRMADAMLAERAKPT